MCLPSSLRGSAVSLGLGAGLGGAGSMRSWELGGLPELPPCQQHVSPCEQWPPPLTVRLLLGLDPEPSPSGLVPGLPGDLDPRERLLGGGVGSGGAIKTLMRGDGWGSESSKVAPGSPTPLPTRPWGCSSAIKLFNCIWDKAPVNGFSLPDSTYSKGVFIKVAAAKLCFCTHP